MNNKELKNTARMILDQVSIEKSRYLVGKWGSKQLAGEMLGIGPEALKKLADRHEIRISKPTAKIIRYDLASIDEYLEKHTNY